MHSHDCQYCYEQLVKVEPWLPMSQLECQHIDPKWKDWVVLGGSLTLALKKMSRASFGLNVLRQESHSAQNLVREVELIVDGQAFVFAHSIVPKELSDTLEELGGKPLGELLFQQGQEIKDQREYALFDVGANNGFARRTPYRYQHHTVIVSEFFLAPFIRFISQ